MYPLYISSAPGKYAWRITVQPEFAIRLTVDDCVLKRDTTITVHDGFDSNAETLLTIESDNIPTEPITYVTNVLFIEFEISIFSDSKFKLVWNEVPKPETTIESNVTNSLNCSANSVITVNEGEQLKLHSPGFPEGYAPNLNCVWTFLPVKMGYTVSISMLTLDLEVVPDCLADFVRIGSGTDLSNFEEQSPMCSLNHLTPSQRYHGTPNLKVQFQTDISMNRTGFEAVVALDCGGILTGEPSGELTNKMTFSNYSAYWMNTTCHWSIDVARGRTIQFEFDKLKLAKNDDGSCNSYIIIRNGIHDDSPFLGTGKYCSGSPSIPITSGNKAIVQYTSSHIFRKTNEFILKYSQVEHECGGQKILDHNTNTIEISSPNYPNIPSPHIECIWRVSAPNGELLKIEFLERFDLTKSRGCPNEYVEIHEGTTSTAPLVDRYCRDKPQPIFTSSNMMRVTYFTDVPIPKNGFKAKISLARCGKSIVANSGFIASPGYPAKGAYPTSATCDYHIRAERSSPFNITFLDLDLPEAWNCSEVDHIIIYSVTRKTSGEAAYREIHTFCGQSKPDTFDTVSSNIMIRFVTKSANVLYSGFHLKFEATFKDCGSRIEADTGVITSPGYPNSLAMHSRFCQWFIQVPKGKRVKVDVIDFDIGTSEDDSSNGIIFHEDPEFRDYIGFYDKDNVTEMKPTYSSDNKMAVTSIMTFSFGHRGFKLRFNSDEPTICIGNLNENQGVFETPANKTKFSCEFERESHKPFIESDPMAGTLSIQVLQEPWFSTFTQCIADLSTGIGALFYPSEDEVKYQTKCPPKYKSIVTPNPKFKLLVSNNAYYKYKFPYKIHNCGRRFTGSLQSITLPTLSSSYGELDCAWQYSSNLDHNIQLFVNAPAMDCSREYIAIYRGQSSQRPHAAQICGGNEISNQSVTINGQDVYIEYHTDSYSQSTANVLRIEIRTEDGICGGIIDSPNYRFSSPLNGSKYPANTHCEWIIKARNGYHIGLTFVSRFMIEQSPNCTKDYLQIFDKVNGQFQEIKKICGREVPPFVNSTGREMKLVFHTDGEGNGDGFHVKWMENCGGIFRASSKAQYISSPNYPNNYPRLVSFLFYLK